LKPVNREIVLDDELEVAQWMPLEEFRAVNKHPMLDKMVELIISKQPGSEEIEMLRSDGVSFKMYAPNDKINEKP
jgi:hypothetical protein